MPARRKIPLVWKTQKESEQRLFKFDTTRQRVVQVGCDCPPPPPPPVCTPPAYVTLEISGLDLVITFPNGILIQEYNGYLVRVIDNVIITQVIANVNTGGTYTVPNGVTGLTPGLEYRILLTSDGFSGPDCQFSTYSNNITGPALLFQFQRTNTPGDPGSGNFSIIPISLPTVSLSISVTDFNSQNATTWLSTEVAFSTTIKIQKDLSNYVILLRSTSTDNTTYWQFDCTISSSVGVVNVGDNVTITYN